MAGLADAAEAAVRQWFGANFRERGELGTLRNVAKASWVAMCAGADVIKTSTGKEPVNATLPVALTMARAIRAGPCPSKTSRAVSATPIRTFRWL